VQLAAFTDDLTPFLAMEVMEAGLALSAQGHDIVQLAVGEPEGPPPPQVIDETLRSLQRGETRYTSSRGLDELCEAIAREASERRACDVRPEQVLVTSGTSPALYMVLRILLEPGDEALIPTPHYPCYPNMVRACGATPVFVPTLASDGFAIDPRRVAAAITPRTLPPAKRATPSGPGRGVPSLRESPGQLSRNAGLGEPALHGSGLPAPGDGHGILRGAGTGDDRGRVLAAP
jgi:aspartate aminotransferase